MGLADDEIPGVVLEPGGVQKREETENKEDKGQCPVDHDPARKPPHPHDYNATPSGQHSGTKRRAKSSNNPGMNLTRSGSSARSVVTDSALVERIGTGDQVAFEVLMRKYNGKLF